jgi:hypothetical protein
VIYQDGVTYVFRVRNVKWYGSGSIVAVGDSFVGIVALGGVITKRMVMISCCSGVIFCCGVIAVCGDGFVGIVALGGVITKRMVMISCCSDVIFCCSVVAVCGDTGGVVVHFLFLGLGSFS